MTNNNKRGVPLLVAEYGNLATFTIDHAKYNSRLQSNYLGFRETKEPSC